MIEPLQIQKNGARKPCWELEAKWYAIVSLWQGMSCNIEALCWEINNWYLLFRVDPSCFYFTMNFVFLICYESSFFLSLNKERKISCWNWSSNSQVYFSCYYFSRLVDLLISLYAEITLVELTFRMFSTHSKILNKD